MSAPLENAPPVSRPSQAAVGAGGLSAGSSNPTRSAVSRAQKRRATGTAASGTADGRASKKASKIQWTLAATTLQTNLLSESSEIRTALKSANKHKKLGSIERCGRRSSMGPTTLRHLTPSELEGAGSDGALPVIGDDEASARSSPAGKRSDGSATKVVSMGSEPLSPPARRAPRGLARPNGAATGGPVRGNSASLPTSHNSSPLPAEIPRVVRRGALKRKQPSSEKSWLELNGW